MSSAPFPELKSHSGTGEACSSSPSNPLSSSQAISSPPASTAKIGKEDTPTPISHSQPRKESQGSDIRSSPSSSTPGTSIPSPAGVPGSQQSTGQHGARLPTSFNPLIYGNDVDSVDVATRIAMVCPIPAELASFTTSFISWPSHDVMS